MPWWCLYRVENLSNHVHTDLHRKWKSVGGTMLFVIHDVFVVFDVVLDICIQNWWFSINEVSCESLAYEAVSGLSCEYEDALPSLNETRELFLNWIYFFFYIEQYELTSTLWNPFVYITLTTTLWSWRSCKVGFYTFSCRQRTALVTTCMSPLRKSSGRVPQSSASCEVIQCSFDTKKACFGSKINTKMPGSTQKCPVWHKNIRQSMHQLTLPLSNIHTHTHPPYWIDFSNFIQTFCIYIYIWPCTCRILNIV